MLRRLTVALVVICVLGNILVESLIQDEAEDDPHPFAIEEELREAEEEAEAEEGFSYLEDEEEKIMMGESMAEDEIIDLEKRQMEVEESESEDDETIEVERRKYKPDPLPEGGTDPSAVYAHETVVKARAMAHLLKFQNVVATCRFILFKDFKDFYEAKHHCENVEWPFTHNGIGIATILNEYENTDARHLLQAGFGLKILGGPYSRLNWAWIGLTKVLNNKGKLPKDQKGAKNYNREEWRWADGNIKPNDFHKWARKMPDQQCSKKFGECQTWVMINKRGTWDDTYASMKAPFLCNYCGKYIVVATPRSWYKAKALCESYGLEMAIVNSKEENEEIGWAANITFNYEPTHPERWNKMNWIWLGTEEVMDSNDEGTGEWKHWNGKKLEFDPDWDRKDQPDNWTKRRGEQSKVAFSRINKKWDDSFYWKKRPFACQCPKRGCNFTHQEQAGNYGKGK